MSEATREISGPCYQFAAVADSLLCGLVGKIVAWMEMQAALGDEFDRADVGCGLV
jgi:hypothetical protein